MDPAYVRRVEMQEFFAPPGAIPLTTAGPLPRLISRDEVHVKQFSSNTIYRELDVFFQQLHEKYGEYRVIETLELEDIVLLFYAVPRCCMRDLPSLCGPAAEGL